MKHRSKFDSRISRMYPSCHMSLVNRFFPSESTETQIWQTRFHVNKYMPSRHNMTNRQCIDEDCIKAYPLLAPHISANSSCPFKHLLVKNAHCRQENAPKIPFEMSIPQQHAFYVHYIKNIDSSQKNFSTLSLLYYILGNIRDNNEDIY